MLPSGAPPKPSLPGRIASPGMPPRRHWADLRGRRHDLGIGIRDMAAGLGIGLDLLLSIEDGTATEEDKRSIGRGYAVLKGGPSGRDISRCSTRVPAAGSDRDVAATSTGADRPR